MYFDENAREKDKSLDENLNDIIFTREYLKQKMIIVINWYGFIYI